MSKRALILYLPVIHQGYLNLLEGIDAESEIYLLDNKFVAQLSDVEPTIAVMPTARVKVLLKTFGWSEVRVLDETTIAEVEKKQLILVDDQISRTLHQRWLPNADVEYVSVFLRWDREAVFSDNTFDGETTVSSQHQQFLQAAYTEAEHSSDWWRQVGCVVVKEGRVILQGYNQGMPSDHTPYQQGGVRDYLKAGEQSEYANYIHSEQLVIAEAARQGIELENTDIYVTHFPCPVCAKLMARAGFAHCFFSEGSSSADGLQVLEAAEVRVVQVKGVAHAQTNNKD